MQGTEERIAPWGRLHAHTRLSTSQRPKVAHQARLRGGREAARTRHHRTGSYLLIGPRDGQLSQRSNTTPPR
jgi:hypothetical protein